MRGDAIDDAALRHVWQDTAIPGVNDGPYVEEFYRAVRALNATLPKEKRYRVLGGDPPIDWDHITGKEDLRKWTVRRDTRDSERAIPADADGGPGGRDSWRGVNPPPTPILLSKETCADPNYLPMRLKRIALAGLTQAEADAVKKACER